MRDLTDNQHKALGKGIVDVVTAAGSGDRAGMVVALPDGRTAGTTWRPGHRENYPSTKQEWEDVLVHMAKVLASRLSWGDYSERDE